MGSSIFDQTMVDMAWPAIAQAARQGALVLLPTGVIEEHGPHLNLGVDILTSTLLCRQVKQALEDKGLTTLICPPFYWGINTATGGFPGSFSVRKQTMTHLLVDILVSLNQWGFGRVFNINWHGDSDHNQAIFDAFEQGRTQTGLDARCIVTPLEVKRYGFTGQEPHLLVLRHPPSMGAPTQWVDLHAGSLETAIMSAYFPDDIDADHARRLAPTTLTFADLGRWSQDAKKETPLGYLGDPAGFDPDAGRAYIQQMTAALTALIEEVATRRAE